MPDVISQYWLKPIAQWLLYSVANLRGGFLPELFSLALDEHAFALKCLQVTQCARTPCPINQSSMHVLTLCALPIDLDAAACAVIAGIYRSDFEIGRTSDPGPIEQHAAPRERECKEASSHCMRLRDAVNVCKCID